MPYLTKSWNFFWWCLLSPKVPLMEIRRNAFCGNCCWCMPQMEIPSLCRFFFSRRKTMRGRHSQMMQMVYICWRWQRRQQTIYTRKMRNVFSCINSSMQWVNLCLYVEAPVFFFSSRMYKGFWHSILNSICSWLKLSLGDQSRPSRSSIICNDTFFTVKLCAKSFSLIFLIFYPLFNVL